MRNCAAIIWFSSTLTLTMRTLPLVAVTAASSCGPSVLHGPHHGAQKSTMTGTSRLASITSAMKLASVTSRTIPPAGAALFWPNSSMSAPSVCVRPYMSATGQKAKRDAHAPALFCWKIPPPEASAGPAGAPAATARHRPPPAESRRPRPRRSVEERRHLGHDHRVLGQRPVHQRAFLGVDLVARRLAFRQACRSR